MIIKLDPFSFLLLDRTVNRNNFNCGSEELNSFLRTKARANQTLGFNRTFVVISQKDEKRDVLGFYCLSMGEVDCAALPISLAQKLPKHPVPIARMGRLAVDLSVQGKGLGKLLLVDAMTKVLQASQQVGVYALIVDAKDLPAKNFYLKFGFIPFLHNPLILFLPLASFSSLKV